jgi:hypothetical protein
MAGLSRPKDGVSSLAYVRAVVGDEPCPRACSRSTFTASRAPFRWSWSICRASNNCIANQIFLETEGHRQGGPPGSAGRGKF